MDRCCICDGPIDCLTEKCKFCKVSKEDLTKSPDKYLTRILNEVNILSDLPFNLYMNKLVTQYNFQLIDNFNKLGLYKHNDYTERRIFSKEIYLTNKIIDEKLEYLHLVDSEKISFVNCIFKCAVTISEISKKINEIYIDNCIFLDKLNIYGIDEMSKLDIYCSNINEFVIDDLKSKDILIASCKIPSFKMTLIKSNTLHAYYNKIEDFIFSENIINDMKFDYKQLNIKRTFQHYLKHINLPFSFFNDNNNCTDLFTFLHSSNSSKDETKENTYFNNIDFLRKYTSIETNKKDYNDLLLLESLLHQQKKSSKYLMWIFGGFIKPINFIIIAIVVVLIFSLLYLFPFANFNVGGGKFTRHLNFLETLYFSGITFTTIGYGDISPIGLVRLLVVIEGFLGILISSSLLTAFIRKHIN